MNARFFSMLWLLYAFCFSYLFCMLCSFIPYLIEYRHSWNLPLGIALDKWGCMTQPNVASLAFLTFLLSPILVIEEGAMSWRMSSSGIQRCAGSKVAKQLLICWGQHCCSWMLTGCWQLLAAWNILPGWLLRIFRLLHTAIDLWWLYVEWRTRENVVKSDIDRCDDHLQSLKLLLLIAYKPKTLILSGHMHVMSTTQIFVKTFVYNSMRKQGQTYDESDFNHLGDLITREDIYITSDKLMSGPCLCKFAYSIWGASKLPWLHTFLWHWIHHMDGNVKCWVHLLTLT